MRNGILCQGYGLTREWGKALPKPRIDHYRVRREADPLAKASHWDFLRRQDLCSPEMRVGRPTEKTFLSECPSSEYYFGMVMVMFYF